MLGGIKVKGEGPDAGISLFRILARKWKPVVPLRRRGVQLASMLPADQQAETTRRWIGKPRRVTVVAPDPAKSQRPTWNRWLWMK